MIMTNRYLEVGGTIATVFNSLYILEKIYPLEILENAEIRLHHYNPKGYNNYTLMNRKKPVLYLLQDKWDWQNDKVDGENDDLIRKVAISNGMADSNVTLDFHISCTIAHEWAHLIQTAGKEFFPILLPSYFGHLSDRENDAEFFAWAFITKYWKNILTIDKIPQTLQINFNPSASDQLILNFNPIP